mmetsp:Transcript_20168/g.45706  ORF Transcript_20168/g.45706 Transcript_20168/m.45706 type:complete len:108 (+) Transcript_20168:180-503(+)
MTNRRSMPSLHIVGNRLTCSSLSSNGNIQLSVCRSSPPSTRQKRWKRSSILTGFPPFLFTLATALIGMANGASSGILHGDRFIQVENDGDGSNVLGGMSSLAFDIRN